MGYMHISNLYKNKDILLFKRCLAMEKCHGTSANVSYTKENDQLHFFSGGASHELFISLFNKEELLKKFQENAAEHPEVRKITIYGEAAGGRLQGMSHTYGPNLFFIAFEVKIDDMWMGVIQAQRIAERLGFEFIPYEEIDCTEEAINAARDKESEIAIRRGMGHGKMREGVVLRPLIELQHANGGRIISKHKRPEFTERKNTPKIHDPGMDKILKEAEEIAEEWVVPGRVKNILSHWPPEDIKPENTRKFLEDMLEDVLREASGEIEVSDAAKKSIMKKAAILFKRYISEATFEDK